ncbi:putative leucine-rich repeat-containing protein [Lachnellula suecica]|uniref:Putative leucine-rich repeat-containing protein n=1 Tax=Lachnellula suecica TaxID=602035 RepID=A0A8T9C5V5_9HELO|nr:putative leucine-rich repeat-containing protein [Lachnellula suecica]
MDTEDGQFFIKVSKQTYPRVCPFPFSLVLMECVQNLAQFVRTHEKALANALQLRRQQTPKNGQNVPGAVGTSGTPESPTTISQPSASSSSTSSTLAAALSLPYLTFASHNIKPAKLALTSHHLFYLLSRFEDLGIAVGPMNIRLENLHAETTAANYVSFLGQSQRPKGRGSDSGSIHSVSSVRSVMSGMSSLWSNFGLGAAASAAKTEKQKAALEADLKYLYSSFTKIPCLRLAPDRRARLIEGYEEFPFDSAVPLYAFKNLGALEISDIDFRSFFGWDRLADQLRSLTVKRAGIDDPADILISIVLDDMDKRRRRSSKAQMSPTTTWVTSSSPKRSPTMPHAELVKSNSAPGSPDQSSHIDDDDLRTASLMRSGSEGTKSPTKGRPRSNSPARPTSSRTGSAHGHGHLRGSYKVKRSGSGSSHSSGSEGWHNSRGSSSNLLSMGIMPSSKWRFLKHLSLADNGLTSISADSLAPLANTLHSLDLSSNLFQQIPDCLASLTALRALNLSNCMINSLHSLTRNPLPAISALNLRSNRLISIAGVERLYPLERLDLRDNRMTDPTELARLTGIPDLREIWVLGNIFVKTHSSYRVTIFNLFRKTPGYTEDIIIDTYGPGYSERRQLAERVAEKPNVPVVKTAPDYGISSVNVNKPIIEYLPTHEPAVLRKERPQPTAITSEVHSSSTSRRRRTPKRRIVDLSTSETSPSKQPPAVPFPMEEAATAAPGSGVAYNMSPEPSPRTVPSHVPFEPRAPAEVPRIDTTVVPRLPPIQTVSYESPLVKPQPSKESQDWKVGGELYRKKLEALRNEVGNGWLSVLSEEGWEAQKNAQAQGFTAADFSPASTMRSSPTTTRASSQQTIHSGRTLG